MLPVNSLVPPMLILVKVAPTPVISPENPPETFIFPATSNFSEGLAIPIPILPSP